nr:protein YgfX [Noviherbaspirillum massiliense]
MSAVTILVGVLIGAGKVGELPVAPRYSIAIFCLFLAFFGLCHTARHRKHLHIDISGTGLIRLAEIGDNYHSCKHAKWPHLYQDREIVILLDDSTMWSWLLLLRLKTQDGKIRVLPILPDSVSRDSFRALAVACRWIAARNNSLEQECR